MAYERTIVALSIAHSDLTRMPEHLAMMDGTSDWVHFDIADGAFVPRLTFGPPLLPLARRFTRAVFDTHLLVAKPAALVAPLIEAGAGVITIYPAACEAPSAVLASIVVLPAELGFDNIRRLLPEVDVLLVATAAQAYDSAEFVPELLTRVQAAREHREREGLNYLIEVDGGIALPNMASAREAGADVFVVGAPVFGAGDPGLALAMFRAAARNQPLIAASDAVPRTAARPAAPTIRYLKRRAS